MEKNRRSGAKGWAMEGKGFYIVLFLCAAVIGVSSWILLSDAGTNVEDYESAENNANIPAAVVTMLPAGTPAEETQETVETIVQLTPEPAEAELEQEAPETVSSTSVSEYVWPVRGSIDVPYAVEALRYDATMADWRTHDGLDITCALGDQVIAAADGTVAKVYDDELYGTTVVIDHENGIRSIYANLASAPPVWEEDHVTMGQVIGSVGGTALAETNQVPHLHLAMTRDGARIDPRDYLPAQLTAD